MRLKSGICIFTVILALINAGNIFGKVERDAFHGSKSQSSANELKSLTKLPVEILRERLELSASFTFTKNTYIDQPSSFLISECYDLGLSLQGKKYRYELSVLSELAYKHFIDSIWTITSDLIDIDIVRINSIGSRFKNTLSTHFHSALFPVYKLKMSYNDTPLSLRSGGFFNPGEFQIAYGVCYQFWKHSLINLSLASIKLHSFSKYEYPNENSIRGDFKRVWKMDYGFSLSSRISHDLSKRLRWDNLTRIFLNSIDKGTTRIDMSNRMRYKLFKNLGISALTKLSFAPAIHPKTQWIQDIQLGLEWSPSKTK